MKTSIETKVFEKNVIMKKNVILLLSSFLLASPFALAQQTTRSVTAPGTATSASSETEHPLGKFDLDFRGGTPGDLVRAIEKVSGRPLNAIVPIEFAEMQLPALKMKAVTVPQLFAALGAASPRTEGYVSGYQRGGGRGAPTSANYQYVSTSYGFKTEGQPKEDSIWFFYYQKPPVQPKPDSAKECRFYQLAPYLETYKIEDITTAIQTGWKMLGEGSSPEMNFHKDTKLLIAVGDPGKLELIDSVLQQLGVAKKPATNRPVPSRSDEAAKP
jgi:hypothetical protein